MQRGAPVCHCAAPCSPPRPPHTAANVSHSTAASGCDGDGVACPTRRDRHPSPPQPKRPPPPPPTPTSTPLPRRGQAFPPTRGSPAPPMTSARARSWLRTGQLATRRPARPRHPPPARPLPAARARPPLMHASPHAADAIASSYRRSTAAQSTTDHHACGEEEGGRGGAAGEKKMQGAGRKQENEGQAPPPSARHGSPPNKTGSAHAHSRGKSRPPLVPSRQTSPTPPFPRPSAARAHVPPRSLGAYSCT